MVALLLEIKEVKNKKVALTLRNHQHSQLANLNNWGWALAPPCPLILTPAATSPAKVNYSSFHRSLPAVLPHKNSPCSNLASGPHFHLYTQNDLSPVKEYIQLTVPPNPFKLTVKALAEHIKAPWPVYLSTSLPTILDWHCSASGLNTLGAAQCPLMFPLWLSCARSPPWPTRYFLHLSSTRGLYHSTLYTGLYLAVHVSVCSSVWGLPCICITSTWADP
jgi:hypothetical protein